MLRVPFPKIKPGDELTTKWLGELRAWVLRNTIVSISPPLTASQNDDGIAIGIGSQTGGNSLSPGLTTSTISARSGTTPGHGNVLLYLLDTTGPSIASTGTTVVAYNISSTSGGIPNNTYVLVSKDTNGNYWVTTADCGN